MMFPQIMETIYSPALPNIAENFAVSVAAASQTLSVYFMAFAIGVFCWGRLADIIGRRKAMLAGLVCYAIGSALALMVSDFSLLLLARVLSAFGAAVGSVITQTMMRDSYSGEELAKVFSVMGMSLGISPVIGLLLGSVLSAYWGYQGVFVALMVSAIVLLFLSVRSLPETKPAHTQKIAIGELAIKMLTDSGIIKNTLLVAAFNLMWFSYFSLAPFMFEAQGLSTLAFGTSGLLLGFGTFLGSYVNKIMLGRGHTGARLVRLASAIALVGGLGIWLIQSTFIGLNNVYFFSAYAIDCDCLRYRDSEHTLLGSGKLPRLCGLCWRTLRTVLLHFVGTRFRRRRNHSPFRYSDYVKCTALCWIRCKCGLSP